MKFKRKILLRPEDFKPSFEQWEVEGVLNPAAVRLNNGDIFLYIRVAERNTVHSEHSLHCPVIVSEEDYEMSGEFIKKAEIVSTDRNIVYLKSGVCRLMNISHFRAVLLDSNGLSIKEISDLPGFTGTASDGEYGVEDPRIVFLDGKYYMTYVSVSKKEGVSSSLAVSNDLKKWERKGIIFREQNKDTVLFPEKINGKYVALNRPEVFYEFHRPAIWIAFSPDLKYWGNESSLLLPREKSWESERLGAGAPPLKTKNGWLLFYHGVRTYGADKYVYSSGAALLDLKNPRRVIARTSTSKPLFNATYKFEEMSHENKIVVFPTGIVFDMNRKDLIIYSGAGDRYVSVGKLSLKDVLVSLEKMK